MLFVLSKDYRPNPALAQIPLNQLFSLKNGLQDVAVIYAYKNAEDFTLGTVIFISVHCSSA